MPSLAELRKELREHRKSEVKPVSRMKKSDVILELERRKPVEKVVVALKKASAPVEVVEKAVAVVEKKKSRK